MPISSVGNMAHLEVACPVGSAASEPKISDKPDSGEINGRKADVGSGTEGADGRSKAKKHVQEFASKLLSIGFSAVSMPVTLFKTVTSALISPFHSLANFNSVAGYGPDEGYGVYKQDDAPTTKFVSPQDNQIEATPIEVGKQVPDTEFKKENLSAKEQMLANLFAGGDKSDIDFKKENLSAQEQALADFFNQNADDKDV